MTGKYVIYPLHLGDWIRPRRHIFYKEESGELMTCPILAWYVTDGKNKLLIDNGGPPPGTEHQPYTKSEQQEPLRVLERLGVDPADIKHVIMTHLHWDHAGNNALFPNATFYAQRAELAFVDSLKNTSKDAYDYELLSQTDYELIDGDCHILKGISVITVPGHTEGSQAVIVDTEGGRYLIAGDLIDLYECYESDPMRLNGVCFDADIFRMSMEKVKSLGYTMLPAHDPRVMEHLCYPY